MNTIGKWIFAVLLTLLLAAGCSQALNLSTSTPTLVVSATPFQPILPQPTESPLPSPTAEGIEGGAVEGLSAFHRSGQTFVTWNERADLDGERYRIYRSSQPISPDHLAQASLLAEVGENAARFYANFFNDGDDQWKARYLDRLAVEDGAEPLGEGVGLLVWTVSEEDLDGQTAGSGYYAVTVVTAGGKESFANEAAVGPVEETLEAPMPVEISASPGLEQKAGLHVYIQYMDLRHWNATFHAPNPSNQFYGMDPNTPGLAEALQYAYDYVIFTPSAEVCGGSLPDNLPVVMYLHGWRGNRYTATYDNPFPYCAYGVYPVDVTETWYFGFAQQHDYRQGGEVSEGDVIENYTEQRLLRMLFDLERDPPGPAVDAERVYVFGHSMGGSGALALAERYSNVFAAAYSGEPISDYRTAGVTHQDWAANAAVKWGPPELNLPVKIAAPADWAAALQKYNGVGVWDWQDYQANLAERAGDGMAPLGIDSEIADHVIIFETQGRPLYPLLDASRQAWAGAVTDADHEWLDFLALPPGMGKVDEAPFWNLQVRRNESLPGLSRVEDAPPTPPEEPTRYNQTIMWSSSWNPWDGAPVDEQALWQMSFCAVADGSDTCGTGEAQRVRVTPRRLQQFEVQPGALYAWENRRAADNELIDSGVVQADENGLVTVPDFEVLPEGNRLSLRPYQAAAQSAAAVYG